MQTIDVGGNSYAIGKMAPREQFHMLRRLTPLMSAAGPAALSLLEGERSKAEVLAEVIASMGPMSDVLASMPDEQMDYVLDACLLRVSRLDKDGKSHPICVRVPGGLSRMYQDIDLAAELRLVEAVVRENLAGFFGALSAGAGSTPNADTLAGLARS